MANLLDQILANLGNFGKDAKKNVVNPTVQEAKKIYNTVQAPVTGIVGAASAGADQVFNGGRNAQNLLNATKLQMNQNINRSLVPQVVAQGKASPLQFGQSFAKTGVELAPYAIGGAGGALTKTLGKTVASKVGENLLGRAAGQTARIGANAAISAPTFAGLNALQQGVDSGFRQFDAGQANIAGLQAGAMTAAGDLAPIVAKGLVKGTKAAGKASVQAVDDATRAAADKTTDRIASTLGQNRGIHQNNFEPSLVNIAKPEDIKAANKYIQQAAKGKDIGSITTTLNKDGYVEPATKQGLQKYLAYKKLYETGVDMNPATNDFGGAAIVDRPFKDVPVNHIDENTLRDGLSAYRMQREGGYIGWGDSAETFQRAQIDPARKALAQFDSERGRPQRDSDGNSYLEFTPEDQAKRDILQQNINDLYSQKNTISAQKQIEQARSSSQKKSIKKTEDYSDTSKDLRDYVKDQVKDQQAATKASTKEKLTNFLDNTKHSLVDDAVAYERYIKDKPTRQNLREGVDRVRSSSVIAKQFVEDNGFKKLGKMKANDLDEFQQYLIAKRAKELEARGVTTGRNQTMDSALVKQVGDKFKSQEKIVRDYSRKMLDYSVDKGMISASLRDKLVKESPDYVPMNRIFDELEAKGIHKSKQLGSLSKQSVVQKIKGSERTVDNPIESIIKNTERMINEGERNNVARQIAGHDSFKGRILKEGEKPQPGNDTLSWLDNGEKKTVEVPELVAREMKNLNGVIPGYLDTALKVAGFPTKLLRSGATTANPVFAASNVIRDQLQTTITGSIKANIKGTPKAFSAAFLPGKEANALRAEMSRNGIIGNQYRQTYGYKSGQLIKELKANSEIDGIAWEKIKHPIDAVADLIGRTEYFTRAQQFYGTAGDLAVRSQAARNNTLNFGRGGVLVRELNKVIPFINAGVQGGRITVNQLHDRPVRTLAAFGTFTGLALAAKAFNQQQNADLYNRLSDEEKKNNLIIFGPDAHYDGNENKVVGITKIPMPQMLYPLLDGVNNVKGKPEDIARIAGDTFTAITGLDATNPINQLTPTFAKPAVEIGLNKSTYSGQDIVSDYEKNNNPEDMGSNYSSGLARTIAKSTGIPAPDIDNVISNYGGGLAKDLTRALSNNPDNAKDGGGIASLFDQGFTRRFMAGAVTSQYDIQAGLAQGYKKQLKNDPSFTSLSKDDQTKVLDKVDSDTKAIAGIAAKTEQNKTDDIKKDLSARQKSLLSDGFNASTYLKDATTTTTTKSASAKLSPSLDSTSKSVLSQYSKLSTDDRSKKFYSDPSAEYQYDLAKYKNDSANGKLSKTQDIKQQTSLAKEKVGSQFDKNTRDIYNGLSASQLHQYASTDPDGNNIVKKVLAYGDALDSAGVSTNKFRTSKGAVNIKAKSSGSASSSKKASKASYKPASNTALLSAYKAAKNVRIRKVASTKGKAKGLVAYKKPAQAKQFKA